ncbi:MAG: copper homeostasis protein CutC [Flavobacteriaceae bacterium]|nr:copper homeostasis protein CutC [Flavobacteriaceae bacterium]
MIVEICANSFESAQNAKLGGAHRIELCENLSVGGVTPSRELIKMVIAEIGIETHVLIRPRGGDFVYSEKELLQMLEDIQFCKDVGCKGVVSGVLTVEKHIDVLNTDRLIQVARGMEFTFHRAIDVVVDPTSEIEKLKELGVNRLLSSGGELSAKDGLENLIQFKNISEGKMEIMPGGGINSGNVETFKLAGFTSVHLSAIPKSESPTSLFDQKVDGVSNLDEIKKVVQLLA